MVRTDGADFWQLCADIKDVLGKGSESVRNERVGGALDILVASAPASIEFDLNQIQTADQLLQWLNTRELPKPRPWSERSRLIRRLDEVS